LVNQEVYNMSQNRKSIAFGMTAMMVLSALLVFAPAVTADTGGRQVNYVDNVSISPSVFYPGDHPVAVSIQIHNAKPTWPTTLVNTTVQITGVSGPVNPFYVTTPGSTNGPNVNFTGYQTFIGFRLDVQSTVACGMYTLTFVVDYQYQPSAWTDPYYHETEQESIQVEVRSILGMDTQIRHYYDDNSYPPSSKSTLYAGETFQRVGINAPAGGAYNVRNVEGDKIVGTLTDKSGNDYTGFTWEQKSATIQNATWWSYFIFRLSIDPSKKAGRYDYNFELSYTRQDSYTGGATTQIKETSVVSIFVDFTPLLDISSGQKQSFTQGSMTTFGVNVTFKNAGNCPLNKLYIGIDISNYFEFHGGMYYDGHGSRTFSGTELYVETMPVGGETTVMFLTDVYKYIPAGEHRLSVLYHGYYYDDGSFKYTDYKSTNQNTYYSIKQKDLYVQIDVADPVADVYAELSDSISMAGRVKDVTLPILLTNKEDVQFDDVVVSLACFPKSISTNALFINAKNPSAKSLEPISIMHVWASSQQTVDFKADLSANAAPGFYEVELTFNATNRNTRGFMTKVIPVSVRVVPSPAKFFISGEYTAKDVKAGKEFPLTLQLQNIGLDTAREVFVTFDDPAGDKPQSYVINGDRVDAYQIDGFLNPFSVRSSRTYVGEIGPQSTFSQVYQVFVDKNIAKSKRYEMSVTVAYRDSYGMTWTQQTEISIMANGSAPEKPVDNSPWMNPLGVGTLLLIIGWFVVILGYLAYRRINRPRMHGYSSMQALPPEQPVLVAPAAPVQQQPQYPPPPPQQAMAQPAPPMAHPPQPHKVCRKCQMTVDPREMSCPRCGNPMK